MRLRRICALALGLLLGLAHALPAAAQTRTGIVLVHGKQRSPQTLQGLTDALTAAGYLVDRPEMCWSERRIYDLPYLDSCATLTPQSSGCAQPAPQRPWLRDKVSAATRRWAMGRGATACSVSSPWRLRRRWNS